MSALGVLLDKDSWLLEIDTDWESGIKEYIWNWDNDEHPPLEEGRKELADIRTRIAELENPWQPIDSCPKGMIQISGVPGYPYALTSRKMKEGYWLGLLPSQKPTHWKHLPKPPEETE